MSFKELGKKDFFYTVAKGMRGLLVFHGTAKRLFAVLILTGVGLILPAAASAVPFDITVTGSTLLSNASLDVTGGNVDLTDGVTANVQIGTLSMTNPPGGVAAGSVPFNLVFGVTSDGAAGSPVPAGGDSVGGTLFQGPFFSSVLALAELAVNPSIVTFDFDFGILTLSVATVSVFISDAGIPSGSTPFNVSATFIADQQVPVPEPATFTLFGTGMLGLIAGLPVVRGPSRDPTYHRRRRRGQAAPGPGAAPGFAGKGGKKGTDLFFMPFNRG